MRVLQLPMRRLLLFLAAISAVAISCGSTVQDESANDDPAERTEAFDEPDPGVLSASEAGLVTCEDADDDPESEGHTPYRPDTFRKTQLWLEVDDFTAEAAQVTLENGRAATVASREVEDGVVAQNVESVSVLLLGTEPDSLRYALSDPRVEGIYLGVSRNIDRDQIDTEFIVWQSFATFTDGGGSFLGGCEARGLNEFVAQEHGTGLVGFGNGFLSRTSERLLEFVGGDPR